MGSPSTAFRNALVLTAIATVIVSAALTAGLYLIVLAGARLLESTALLPAASESAARAASPAYREVLLLGALLAALPFAIALSIRIFRLMLMSARLAEGEAEGSPPLRPYLAWSQPVPSPTRRRPSPAAAFGRRSSRVVPLRRSGSRGRGKAG